MVVDPGELAMPHKPARNVALITMSTDIIFLRAPHRHVNVNRHCVHRRRPLESC
jgi:hypothetical protein